MPTQRWRGPVLVVLLLSAVVGLQAVRDAQTPLASPTQAAVLYVRSAAVLERVALSYRALLADLYWLRAVQHFGRTKLSNDPDKRYDLLYPLLDLTTSLDPRFNVAYRFGAIFLAEPFPGGPGRPDQAIMLLEKGLRGQPDRWELAEDIGFVYYWWLDDPERAADWFARAAKMSGAPEWLAPVAAVTLAQGGNRDSSRRLWREIARTAEADWLRGAAALRLRQLDAMDQIDALEALAARLPRGAGRGAARSGSDGAGSDGAGSDGAGSDGSGSEGAGSEARGADGWTALVRAGLLPGAPLDPLGVPYRLTADGTVTLSPQSGLNPLPVERGARR